MVTITNNGRLMIQFGKNITHNDTKNIIIHTNFKLDSFDITVRKLSGMIEWKKYTWLHINHV